MAQMRDLSMTKLENLDLDVSAVPSLAKAMLSSCRFAKGAVMPGDLSEALFVDCAMPDLSFVSASLFGARFIRCDLSRSRFDRCDLSAASFVDCIWQGVVLQDCDIDAAQLPDMAAA
jgi:uncharacterized protein YjbI with pentapeptide repeats